MDMMNMEARLMVMAIIFYEKGCESHIELPEERFNSDSKLFGIGADTKPISAGDGFSW